MQNIMIENKILEKATIKKDKYEDNFYIHMKFTKGITSLVFASQMYTLIMSNDLCITIDKNSINFSTTNSEYLKFNVLIPDNDIIIVDTSNEITTLKETGIDNYTIFIDKHTTNLSKENRIFIPLFNQDDIV